MSQVSDRSDKHREPRAGAYARVQTGVRMEKRLVKVLKGLAEYGDVSLGELMERICLHALEGSEAFGQHTLDQIISLKRVYGLDWIADSNAKLAE